VSRNLLPTRCEKCPLKDAPTVQGFGPGDGMAVLGEAPGNTEVQQKRAFVGQAGRLLRVVLRKTGIEADEEVYYTNSVLCHPPGNKTPGIAQIRGCRSRLEEELALVAPTKILAVGGVALTAVLRSDKAAPITRWHGRGVWTEWGGRLVYTLATFHPAAVLRDPEYFRDFAADILKWSEFSSPLPDLQVSHVVPVSVGAAVRSLNAIKDMRDLTIDLETTGEDPVTDRIVSVGIGNDDAGVIINPFLLRVPLMRKMLRQFLLETYGGEFALWNAKFDIQFLDVYFNECIRPRAADCMVMHYTLDERPFSKYKSHGLKTQARIHYDAEDYDFDFSQGLGKARLTALYEYQAKDLAYTSKLKRDLADDMEQQSPHLARLFYTLLMPATYTLAEMELHGVKIDRPYLEQLRETTQVQIDEKKARLQALAAKHGMENFNPASHPQLATLIYKHWKAPKPHLVGKRAMEMPSDTTAKDVLFGLAQRVDDPEVKQGLTDIVDLRLLEKVMATYIEKILKMLGPDGRLRSDFKLLGTATGRLSSAAPNIQNIPLLMGNEIRNAFIPSPGYVWVAADYSQLELRVAAVLAGDEAMQDVFRTNRDIHTEVASMIFKKPAAEVTKAERIMAKHVDFGIIYGRSAQSLVEGAELEYKDPDAEWWSIDEAELFLYRFLNGFPKLKAWIETTKKFALEHQYVESPLGRRRRWPFIAPGTANSVGREAANFPIQGTASDICLDAMIHLHDELPKGAYVLFPIHDSINFEVREEILEPVLQQIYQVMVNTKLLHTDVPFDVEIEVGQRWGEMKKWKPES
jgi:DNA polymerase I